MGCLILTELPVKPFALLMYGQGLIDEGLTRSLQDLPCLIRIIAGSHRLEKPIDDGKKHLAPSRHAGSAGQVLSTRLSNLKNRLTLFKQLKKMFNKRKPHYEGLRGRENLPFQMITWNTR
jgi:hypothetical protein